MTLTNREISRGAPRRDLHFPTGMLFPELIPPGVLCERCIPRLATGALCAGRCREEPSVVTGLQVCGIWIRTDQGASFGVSSLAP